MLCEYGCGQEAKYQFKNGKWCCSKSHQQCPILKEKTSLNSKGHVLSNEAKEKIRLSKIGKTRDKKTREKIKRANLGNKHTDETKEKIRQSSLGRIPWNKGKKNCYSNTSNILRKNKMVGNLNPSWKGGYSLKKVATYDTYVNKLQPIEKCRRNKQDKNILEVRCSYCGIWYIPSIESIYERVRVIKGTQLGEQRLYCSNRCKQECPIYKQILFPKGFKISSSREVQPELRQLRFELDNYTCQVCGKHQDELKVGLHCHHLEGIRWEPIESADLDKVITVCKNCHKKIHQKNGCRYYEMKCK